MTLEQAVIETLRDLPLAKQQEVLDFVQFLRHKTVTPRPQPQLKGIWAGVHISDQDIAEVRQEMWSGFPREDV